MPSTPVFSFLLLSRMLYGKKYPFAYFVTSFCYFVTSAWFCAFTASFAPFIPTPSPNLFTVGTEWEQEKALMLCKHCSTGTVLCYQLCFDNKSDDTI